MRWKNYISLKDSSLKLFFQNEIHDNDNILYILGKGFDPRMNLGIKMIQNSNPAVNLELCLIEFNEGRESSSQIYDDFVQKNLIELGNTIFFPKTHTRTIDLWKTVNGKKSRIGDLKAAELFKDQNDFLKYSYIIIDISALPRGIYFSLIGKILSIIDKYMGYNTPNLLILVSENAEIDSKITESGIDEDLRYLKGFGGRQVLSSTIAPIIWFPILGEKKLNHLQKAIQFISPSEICPILPFPSKNPRRSDDIFNEHFQFFEDYQIESQNIIYVPEQDPFQAYRIIKKTIEKYHDSLSILEVAMLS
ncbi:MAG: hypothetical protein R2879_18755 [Saprospiraceae bacterium]